MKLKADLDAGIGQRVPDRSIFALVVAEPVDEKGDAVLDFDAGTIAEALAGFGDVGEGQRDVAGLRGLWAVGAHNPNGGRICRVWRCSPRRRGGRTGLTDWTQRGKPQPKRCV